MAAPCERFDLYLISDHKPPTIPVGLGTSHTSHTLVEGRLADLESLYADRWAKSPFIGDMTFVINACTLAQKN